MPKGEASRRLGDDGPIDQQTVRTRTEERLNVPIRFFAGFPGFDRKSGGIGLLSLEEPGRLQLRPWSNATAVLDKRKALIADGEDQALEDLRLLEDVFQRLAIEANGRVQLPLGALVFLSGTTDSQLVHVVRYPDVIEFWSMSFRERLLALADRPKRRSPGSLADL